jgi:hypothetical protein
MMKKCERAFEEIDEMIKEIGRIHFERCGTTPLNLKQESDKSMLLYCVMKYRSNYKMEDCPVSQNGSFMILERY